MWCLSLPVSESYKIFDLQKVIVDRAWKSFFENEFAHTGCLGNCQQRWARRTFDMKIDWKSISRKDVITHQAVIPHHAGSQDVVTQDGGNVAPPKKMHVFSTVFSNTTEIEEAQVFHFNFQKEVTTTHELNVTEGFSIAGNLEFKPEVKAPLVSGEAGGSVEVSWSGEQSETLEDAHKFLWDVNSDVSVPAGKTVTVNAFIREYEVKKKVMIESRFDLTSFSGVIPVDVVYKKSGANYSIIELPPEDLDDHEDCKGRLLTKDYGFVVNSEAVMTVSSISQEMAIAPA